MARENLGMPMTYEIDREARLVRIQGKGLLTDDEMLSCVVALREDPDLEPDMDTLSDMTDIDVGFTTEGIMKMISVMKRTADRRSTAKAAIVASTDIAFGTGRQFEGQLATTELEPKFHIFRSMEEACAWLGVS